MYIRYNNSSNRPAAHNPPPKQKPCRHPMAEKEQCETKNFLGFLPREIYNPQTHKFFGKISSEDILIIGLILLILDGGCKDDFPLALALLYILLSDYLDFGNIFS